MNSYKEKAISKKYGFLKFLQKRKSYEINRSCAKCGCPISIKTSKKSITWNLLFLILLRINCIVQNAQIELFFNLIK